MTEHAPLSAFDSLVLGAVAALGEGVMGRAIKRAVDGASEHETSYEAIYDALGRLRRGGFIQAVADSPLRYTITEAGRRALAREVKL